jgi:pyruvate dehydrogenase E1 component
MIALVGDAELDEGNIFEAILEGWKQGLRNCWWIIDYNRQSLDAVVREGLWERYEQLFKNFGWDVVILKYGSLQQEAFREPGGETLRQWIDRCPNQLYSALVFQGGAAWRKRLLDEIGDQSAVTRLIESRNDDELARLMNNLGGHDLPSIVEAFDRIDHDRPTCFIAYTVKGFGLPIAGHKDNHAGLMTPAQMESFRGAMNIRAGHEWDLFEGLHTPADTLRTFLERVPFAGGGPRRLRAPRFAAPDRLTVTIQPEMSTQAGFGALLNELAREQTALAERIVTTSPDVTVSTNLGPWVNRRGLFARESMADTFKSERIPSTFNWSFSPKGQHIELGIAEMNLFILLSALGLSHGINGERLLPIGTLYDPFIARGLDALNYACYQDARFILVGTPSGLTLAPEGGAHQSIAEPLIGLAQDGLAAFEPAFVDELAAILAFALDYIQRDGDGEISERNWLREPGPNCEVVVAYTGAVAPEAIQAIGLMAEDRRDVGLLAVTSADRLNAGWTAALRARERGLAHARSHIERLFTGLPTNCGLVTVLDGHPATLGWLGAVLGHRTRPLGVEHFGQTGSIPDLYRHYGIDANAIVAAAQSIAPGRPIRHLRALG